MCREFSISAPAAGYSPSRPRAHCGSACSQPTSTLSAVRVARANARLNRVGALVEVVKANGVMGRSVRARAPFHLIFANILLGPLQRFAVPLTKIAAPGARVILSGLLTSQANAAVAAYRALTLERRIELEGWTTLVLMRRTRPRRTVARGRRGS